MPRRADSETPLPERRFAFAATDAGPETRLACLSRNSAGFPGVIAAPGGYPPVAQC
jgi:hypothetical protein